MPINKSNKKGLIIFSVVLSLFFLMAVLIGADDAASSVTACIAPSCSVANYNTNTSGTVGSTINKNAQDELDFASAGVSGGDTINAVYFSMRYTGFVDLDGFFDITARSQDGLTTYCFLDNVISQQSSGDNYHALIISSGCTTGDGVNTVAELDDLEVVILNQDAGKAEVADITYANVSVDFTPSAGDSCSPTSPLVADHVYIATDNCIASDLDADGFIVECTGTGTLTIPNGVTISNVGGFTANQCEVSYRGSIT